jgi:hypothetical protein
VLNVKKFIAFVLPGVGKAHYRQKAQDMQNPGLTRCSPWLGLLDEETERRMRCIPLVEKVRSAQLKRETNA